MEGYGELMVELTDSLSIPQLDFADWLAYNPTSSSGSPELLPVDSEMEPVAVTSGGLKAWKSVQSLSMPQDEYADTQPSFNPPKQSAQGRTFSQKMDISSCDFLSNNYTDVENFDFSDDIKRIASTLSSSTDLDEKQANDLKNALSEDTLEGDLNNTGATKQDKTQKSTIMLEYKTQSSSSRNKNLRILDNLLLLTSQYIDDSPQSIYLIFPYLLRKIVEVCDESSTWTWAEIYFRTLISLVEKSSEKPNRANSPKSTTCDTSVDSAFSAGSSDDGLSKPKTSMLSSSTSPDRAVGYLSPSPNSFGSYGNSTSTNSLPSTFQKKSKFNRNHEHKSRLFHSYRTSFLVSLTCYLACKMAEFSPTREPGMSQAFSHDIIPTLAYMCEQQKDICDAPGIALMYIFARVDIPIQDLVVKSKHVTLYTKEEFAFDEENFFDDSSIPIGSVSSCVSGIGRSTSFTSSIKEQPRTVYKLIQPKNTTKDQPFYSDVYTTQSISSNTLSFNSSSAFIPRFLHIFWIRCLAMGYYRRSWARLQATEASEDPTSLSAFLLSPASLSGSSGHCDISNFDLTAKDRGFLDVYKKLVVTSYINEPDPTLRNLYILIFGIEKFTQVGTNSHSTASDFNRNAEASIFLYYGDYRITLKSYSEQKLSASLVELLRLIQNSLCRLIPRHVHMKLLMLSIFNVPTTAPFASSSMISKRAYGKVKKNKSTLGRTMFALKQVFTGSNQKSALERFAFYMPESVWEGAFANN